LRSQSSTPCPRARNVSTTVACKPAPKLVSTGWANRTSTRKRVLSVPRRAEISGCGSYGILNARVQSFNAPARADDGERRLGAAAQKPARRFWQSKVNTCPRQSTTEVASSKCEERLSRRENKSPSHGAAHALQCDKSLTSRCLNVDSRKLKRFF
jgi:hypothetical protein